MRRIIIMVALLLATAATAAPIDMGRARTAGAHFLRSQGLIKGGDTLATAETIVRTVCGETVACLYIFNYGGCGFVIVGADDRCTPILGYSQNGAFSRAAAPENMKDWLNCCAESIAAGIAAGAPANSETAKAWQALGDGSWRPAPQPKGRGYLLTSTWGQYGGFNNYCPVMGGEHVVVGCVATAMAQIIRYHRYPKHGFGQSSYNHSVYGVQAVDFDTVEYNYNQLPDDISSHSPAAVQHMASMLCWHCGITVQMDYQNPGYTSGSGALSNRVPGALKHFGYATARYINRTGDDEWKQMIKGEIDSLRPIYYSGASEAGGHAFVLDGYNNNDQFHFNWGWNGYADGFYTLTTMQGFTQSQAMVTHIAPSGWEGNMARFYLSPDGRGDGTSWTEARSDLGSAIVLSQINGKALWMKEGVYCGDTTATYAFRITQPVSIVGGFAGTEASAAERDAAAHPTILDGGGRRGVISCSFNSSYNKRLNITDLTIRNGYSEKGTCAEFKGGGVFLNGLTVVQNVSDSGNAVHLQNCLCRYTRIAGNRGAAVVLNEGANLRQSIISQNCGIAMRLASDGRAVGCDIVANRGLGAVYENSRSSLVGCIVWDNDTNLVLRATPADTSIRSNAIGGGSIYADTLNTRLDDGNDDPDGPRFIRPGSRGCEGYGEETDWQLQRGSVCINRGEKPRDASADGDLDHNLRVRQGRADAGCYESNYLGIGEPGSPEARVYPNPAEHMVTVEGVSAGAWAMLYDLNGREMVRVRASADGVARMCVESLPRGVYMVRADGAAAKVVVR